MRSSNVGALCMTILVSRRKGGNDANDNLPENPNSNNSLEVEPTKTASIEILCQKQRGTEGKIPLVLLSKGLLMTEMPEFLETIPISHALGQADLLFPIPFSFSFPFFNLANSPVNQ